MKPKLKLVAPEPEGPEQVFLVIPFTVIPCVRQTQKTRFAKNGKGEAARSYNDWLAKTRSYIRNNLPRLPEVPWCLSATFYVGPWRDKIGQIYNRALKIDLNNCVKALEDALQDSRPNKVVYPGILKDDKWIRAYGHMEIVECLPGEDRIEFRLERVCVKR